MQINLIQNTLFLACLSLLGGLALGCRPADRAAVSHEKKVAEWRTLLTDDSGELVQEVWEIHTVRGAKVGHRHTRVFDCQSESHNGQRIEAMDFLETKRFGEVVEQQLKTVSWEANEGQLLGIAYELRSGETVIAAGGFVERDRLLLQTTQPHLPKQEKEMLWSSQNGGPFAIERSLRMQPMEPGESRVVEGFVPVLNRIVQWRLFAKEIESVKIDGQALDLLKIIVTDAMPSEWSLPTLLWADGEGQVLRTHEGLLDRITLRSTKQGAMGLNDLARLDLGLDVGVPLANPSFNPHECHQAIYRIRLQGINPVNVFASGPSQQVTPSSNPADGTLLTVQQMTPESTLRSGEEILLPTAEDTRPNALIQSDDRHVRAIADAVAGSIEDPFQASVALEQYLFRQLGKKNFSHVFASAAEVAKNREGDCSEHAVLLAATCRARGIPARVIIGLVYSVPERRFLYHMWNEVWIEDRWIPLDATLGRGGIGAAHLKIRESNLADESAYGLVAPVLFLTDRLEIELVDCQPPA